MWIWDGQFLFALPSTNEPSLTVPSALRMT